VLRYRSTKHPRASNSSQAEHSIPVSPSSSNTTPRTSVRPSLISRTSTATLVPQPTEQPLLVVDEDLDAYSHRDSVASSITSIKDDPFFRNYQSPQSISLARELRSAAHSERMREANAIPDDLPPRSTKRPSVDNSVNLPVCPKRKEEEKSPITAVWRPQLTIIAVCSPNQGAVCQTSTLLSSAAMALGRAH
jgi:hypothetical protein